MNNNIIYSTKPDISKIPGGWEPTSDHLPLLQKPLKVNIIKEVSENTLLLNNVFSSEECYELISFMNRSPNFDSVSVQGRTDVKDDRIGSKRTTIWCPRLAEQFYGKLKNVLQNRMMTNFTATDWWQGDVKRTNWIPIGISPMLRFMKYDEGGQHYAHYDAGFIYPDDNYRTLMSYIVYLTTNENGATRFIYDGQEGFYTWTRNHDDWTREVRKDEILFESVPVCGNVLIFDHRICHDVEKYTGNNPRIIIRGDVIYHSE